MIQLFLIKLLLHKVMLQVAPYPITLILIQFLLISWFHVPSKVWHFQTGARITGIIRSAATAWEKHQFLLYLFKA